MRKISTLKRLRAPGRIENHRRLAQCPRRRSKKWVGKCALLVWPSRPWPWSHQPLCFRAILRPTRGARSRRKLVGQQDRRRGLQAADAALVAAGRSQEDACRPGQLVASRSFSIPNRTRPTIPRRRAPSSPRASIPTRPPSSSWWPAKCISMSKASSRSPPRAARSSTS